MNSLIKGSKLVIFEKCGHLPQEEMPERVVEEITKFAGPDESVDATTHQKRKQRS